MNKLKTKSRSQKQSPKAEAKSISQKDKPEVEARRSSQNQEAEVRSKTAKVGKQKNDSIATKEQQPLLQKPAKKMEGKTQRKENKKEKKAMIGRGKKTWHEKMAEQEKI